MTQKSTGKNVKNISLDDVRKMKDAGELLPTKMSASAPEDLPDNFWNDAEIIEPKNKVAVSLRVDPDVLEFFKMQGRGHLTRMNAVLRSYVEAHRSR